MKVPPIIQVLCPSPTSIPATAPTQRFEPYETLPRLKSTGRTGQDLPLSKEKEREGGLEQGWKRGGRKGQFQRERTVQEGWKGTYKGVVTIGLIVGGRTGDL
jgi:hypothetical protein